MSEGALRGRKALVTGASRRLGRAIALRLADEGADVVVHYRGDEAGAERTLADVKARGRRGAALAADLSDDAACARLAEEAWRALGGIDLLVNNAGVFARTPRATLSVADFDAQIAGNARTTFSMCLHVGKRMKAAGGGAIVNFACASAFRPYGGFVPYSASKAAVANLTGGFAKLLAPEVRVNAIAPGPVLPPEGSTSDDDRRAAQATLLNRWGTADDVTSAVVLLATASYVTGLVLPVDGGRSIA